MSTNIYVGNLPFSTTVEAIQDLFRPYGTVDSVNLITDQATGRLRGFGFVAMTSGADKAIAALHDQQLDGRTLTVTLAKPREQREHKPRRW